MIKDNLKYTATRLFQKINGAETLYINTYAMMTPRLPIFKQITCPRRQVNETDNQDSFKPLTAAKSQKSRLKN